MDAKTRARLQGLARAVAIGITFIPALGKFAAYSQQVTEFQMWGLPNPELLVPVVGVFQFAAMLTLAVGFAGRYGAVTLGVVMLVAMSAVGPTRLNVPVFLSCVTLATLGTGPYSLWDPKLPLIDQWLPGGETATSS